MTTFGKTIAPNEKENTNQLQIATNLASRYFESEATLLFDDIAVA